MKLVLYIHIYTLNDYFVYETILYDTFQNIFII